MIDRISLGTTLYLVVHAASLKWVQSCCNKALWACSNDWVANSIQENLTTSAYYTTYKWFRVVADAQLSHSYLLSPQSYISVKIKPFCAGHMNSLWYKLLAQGGFYMHSTCIVDHYQVLFWEGLFVCIVRSITRNLTQLTALMICPIDKTTASCYLTDNKYISKYISALNYSWEHGR